MQWGAEDVQRAAELADTGRFLVHVLTPDSQAVERLRTQLHEHELYGLISVEAVRAGQALPYTENLVNLFLVQEPLPAPLLADVARVLCPRE